MNRRAGGTGVVKPAGSGALGNPAGSPSKKGGGPGSSNKKKRGSQEDLVEEEKPPVINSGFGRFELSNGATYVGEWLITERGAKVRHGHGTFTKAGETYTGDWYRGTMTGKGMITTHKKPLRPRPTAFCASSLQVAGFCSRICVQR